VARRRKRGTGSLPRQRKDGLWVGQVSLGRNADGTRNRPSFSSKNRGDVEFWMRETLRSHARGDAANERLTVAAYLDDWFDHVSPTVKPTTSYVYRIHIDKWIVPVIGSTHLIRLVPADVRRVTAAVVKGDERGPKSPRTAQSVLVTLRMALRAAVRDGRLERNVAEGVKPPRSTARKVEAIGADQARAVLAAFEDHWMGPLITVAMGSGMRLGELLALRWTDIGNGRIGVTGSLRPTARQVGEDYRLERVEPKTVRSIRTLEPAPFVFEALDLQRRRQAEATVSGYVFTNRAGTFLDPRNVTKAFQTQLRAKGLEPMRFHDLRHAYATLSLTAGVPLRVVQEALGHTSIALTAAVYAHVMPELQREAGAKLQEAMFGR
jgi:integrase